MSNEPHRRRERLVILFIVGVLILHYPLLALFSRVWLSFGIPLLYLYLFLAWLLLIVLLAVVMEKGEGD